MPTLSNSGTQTAVISTEHTLYNPITNKFFTGYIDLSNMTSGDTVLIRVSIIVKTAGSYRMYWEGSYTGAQINPLVYIAPLPSDIGWRLTLTQTTGTGRVYDWRIYEM